MTDPTAPKSAPPKRASRKRRSPKQASPAKDDQATATRPSKLVLFVVAIVLVAGAIVGAYALGKADGERGTPSDPASVPAPVQARTLARTACNEASGATAKRRIEAAPTPEAKYQATRVALRRAEPLAADAVALDSRWETLHTAISDWLAGIAEAPSDPQGWEQRAEPILRTYNEQCQQAGFKQ
jgi:hypothetical protein